MSEKAYEWLKKHSIETAYLLSTAEVLAWDQRTYMPKKGKDHRAEQMVFLTKMLHERSTDERIGENLALVEGGEMVADPLCPAAVNVREWRRDFDKSIKIPRRLAVDLARATSLGESMWQRARPENNWDALAPSIADIVDLVVEQADAIGYAQEPYDALIGEYEPGETASSLEKVFGDLKPALVSLLDSIRETGIAPDTSVLHGLFPVDSQVRFCRHIVSMVGYDLDAGRIDVSAHPFSIGIGPGDVRITTRYQEKFFNASVFGSLHEAGHGMYEQGLPEEHWGTPRGKYASLGIHESQSRFWENMVGRSRGFWRHAYDRARSEFPALNDVPIGKFLLGINAVKPSLIRVEADEITYNLHIMVRFELELGLLRREIAAADLPDAWNEKMKSYLGVDVPDASSGVMQDVHWPSGLIGYFPTYTLGNLFAAQLFNKAQEELGSLEERFAAGEFAPLLKWLREKVHEPGATYSPRDMITRATGSALDPTFFIEYAKKKYGELYGFA